MKKSLIVLAILFITSCNNDTIEVPNINYFPPMNSNNWETQTPSSLQWDENKPLWTGSP